MSVVSFRRAGSNPVFWEEPLSHHPKLTQDRDDIDRLVEEIARHPERADSIKDALRARLSGDASEQAPARSAPAEYGDLDEFWDNVPI